MIDWNEVSAIATSAAALATAVAAAFTAWMVLLTRETIKQTREQHSDNFRPVCTLEPHRDEHLDAHKRNPIVKITSGEHDHWYEIMINARLINVGNGPATDIVLSIDFAPSSGKPLTKNLGVVLAAGNEMDGIRISFSRQTYDELRLGLTLPDDRDGPRDVRESWNMFLTYKDIFGQTLETRHTRDATQPWTVLSRAR